MSPAQLARREEPHAMRVLLARLNNYLSGNTPLEDLASTAAEQGMLCWIVGGALRDVLLGRPVSDIDLATVGDPTELARTWARKQQAHWFWLDEPRRQSRVLLRYGQLEFFFDFAPLRAETIQQDLALRDFTINALAIPLQTPLMDQPLLDFVDGVSDLNLGQLSCCGPSSLSDDPLRVLKGVRHSVSLDFHLSDTCRTQMKAAIPGVDHVAAERKRNELGRILSATDPSEGLRQLAGLGLLPCLFGPADRSFDLDVALAEVQSLTAELNRFADQATLVAELQAGFDETLDRRSLLLLAGFLKHYQPADLVAVLNENLRFSRKSASVLCALVPLDLSDIDPLFKVLDHSRRAFLWIESRGTTALDQILFYVATQKNTIPLEMLGQLFEGYAQSLEHDRIPHLLTGGMILKKFPDVSRHNIGTFQKQIKDLEIEGEIRSRKDAERYLAAEISIDKD